ncbi:phage terminase small subunit-related protein, partial [Lysinibacillus sp. GbtcB16]
MARARSPNRDKAFELFKEHNGDISNRKIAELLQEPEKTISSWKSRDKWAAKLNESECSTAKENECST